MISQSRNGTDSYYLYDALGTTRQFVNVAGAVTDTYLYDSYGEILIRGTTISPFLYVGRHGYYTDADLSTSYLRMRQYSPAVGRFWSRDPISLGLLETNPYWYASNNPVALIDPSGLPQCQPCPKIAGPPVDCNTAIIEIGCCRHCMTCGPEVGNAVLQTLKAIQTKLQGIDANWLHSSVVRHPTIMKRWDLTGMVDLDAGGGKASGPCASLRAQTLCNTCVTVQGKKQDLWEVNYALFGLLMNAANINNAQMLTYVYLYKSFRFVSDKREPCKPQWQLTDQAQALAVSGLYQIPCDRPDKSSVG